jgi:hypothetical protein
VIRRAYAATAATAASTLTCYLDTDNTGSTVTVNFTVYGTANLSEAVPRLVDGSVVFVMLIGASYYCVNLFQYVVTCST